jgi:hypothetical protein
MILCPAISMAGAGLERGIFGIISPLWSGRSGLYTEYVAYELRLAVNSPAMGNGIPSGDPGRVLSSSSVSSTDGVL